MRFKIVLSIIVGLIVLEIIGVGFWWFSSKKKEKIPQLLPTPLPSPARIFDVGEILKPGKGQVAQEEKVAKVGEETLYGSDFNYELLLYFPQEASLLVLSEETKNKVLSQLIEKSIMLQSAKKRGLIELTDEAFNNPNKDFVLRNELSEEAKEKLTEEVEDKISVAGIFMFFYNQQPPAMGIEKAKELTRSTMEVFHKDLLAGRITLEGAAKKISEDKSLAEIDSIYYANAYGEFIDRNRASPIGGAVNQKNNDLLWELKKGELSPILLGLEPGNEPRPNEAYWVIYQVLDKKKGEAETFLEWLEKEKGNYEIEKFI